MSKHRGRRYNRGRQEAHFLQGVSEATRLEFHARTTKGSDNVGRTSLKALVAVSDGESQLEVIGGVEITKPDTSQPPIALKINDATGEARLDIPAIGVSLFGSATTCMAALHLVTGEARTA